MILIIVIYLLLFGLIGYLGWYVYHNWDPGNIYLYDEQDSTNYPDNNLGDEFSLDEDNECENKCNQTEECVGFVIYQKPNGNNGQTQHFCQLKSKMDTSETDELFVSFTNKHKI